jgi:hypothetical protein
MFKSFRTILALAGLASVWAYACAPSSDAALFASNKYPSTCVATTQTIGHSQSVITADGSGTYVDHIDITITAAPTGSAVTGIASWYPAGVSGTVTSVTDNAGNSTYAVIDSLLDASGNGSAASYAGYNLTGAPTVITLHFAGAVGFIRATADVFTNVAMTTPLDGHAAQEQGSTGTGANAVTSGSITPTTAKDMIWAGTNLFAFTGSPTIAVGTGYTSGADGNTGPNTPIRTEYQLQTAATAVAGTFTVGTTSTPMTFVIALKPTISSSGCGGGGGGGGVTPPVTASCYMGAYTGAGFAGGEASMEAMESWLGHSMDFAVEFGGYANASDFTGSPGFILGQWPTGRKLLYSTPLIFSGGTLAAAASGAYDAYYTSIANDIHTANLAGKIFAVRIGAEFNGYNFPWSIHQSGTMADFAAGFRRFALIIKGIDPTIKIDWNSNWGQADPAAGYPGDDVVDVITMDAYEDTQYLSGTGASRWAGFVNQPAGFASLTTMNTFATAHNKPQGFSEYASNFNDGYYVQQMHDWAISHNFLWQAYWNGSSDFNGTLANWPVNQSTYYTDWHNGCGSGGATGVSNAAYIPAAGTPATTLANGSSFQTGTMGYTLYKRFLFDSNATPSTPQDVAISSISDLSANFNPIYSSNVTFFSGNNEWQRYTTSFSSTAHQFTGGTTGSPGHMALVATAPGGIVNGGITSGMIATKLHFQPGTSFPLTNHGIAFRAIIKSDSHSGSFPALWCYQYNNSTTGGANELDFWEGQVVDNGVFGTTTFQDGGGITPGTLISDVWSGPGWDGYKMPLPGGADFSTGYHKMEMVWTTTMLAVYFDDVMMRSFNYTYNASQPAECYINLAETGNGTTPFGQPVTQGAPYPRELDVQEWAIYTAP